MEVTVNKSPGSSPHVRGALAFHGKRGDGDGIIPACAGSTTAQYPTGRVAEGSSPHVRGAPLVSVLSRPG